MRGLGFWDGRKRNWSLPMSSNLSAFRAGRRIAVLRDNIRQLIEQAGRPWAAK